jgi:hypothetical protein
VVEALPDRRLRRRQEHPRPQAARRVDLDVGGPDARRIWGVRWRTRGGAGAAYGVMLRRAARHPPDVDHVVLRG